MTIKIVTNKISRKELQKLAEEIFGDMVKATADIERGVMAIGGELHIDSNELLLKAGSKQTDVWGFNLYPREKGDGFIEYNSLINIKPAFGNRSPDIQDETIKKKIAEIVLRFVE